MRIKRYFRTFSLEELCAGTELLLSGEGKSTFHSIDNEERKKLFSDYDISGEIRLLSLESKLYKDGRNQKNLARVWFDEEKERVLKCDCKCDDFKKDLYGCIHTAAALTAWYIENEGILFFSGTQLETALKNVARVEDPFAPGVMKRTDSRLLQFLHSKEENLLPVWKARKTISKREMIHSEHSVFQVEDVYMLEIKAGTNRKYVIKDLPGFYQIYREGGIYTFGKTQAVLSEHSCDEFTNGLMKLIGEAIELEEKYPHGRRFFTTHTGTGKDMRYFVMNSYFMGRFLELLDGGELVLSDGMNVPVDLKRKGLEATLRKKPHGASLQIKKMNILADGGSLQLFLQDNQGIFRIWSPSTEKLNVVRELVSMSEPLYVRESDIQALRESVLPVFEEFGTLNTMGLDLRKFDREKPELELYLDVEGRSVINCVPYTLYGQQGERYRLFDNSTGNNRRNGAAESEYATYLIQTFDEYDPNEGRLSAYLDDDELYQYLQETIPVLQEKATVYISDRLKNLKVRSLPRLQVKISAKEANLVMSLKGSDLSERELGEILASYSSKKKYFRLKNGTYFHFEEADTQVWETISDLYQNYGEKNASLMKLPLYRALYLNEMLKGREDLVLEADNHYQKLIRSMKNEEKTELPSSLRNVLRPYQEDGFHWIRRLRSIGFGGVLADDMGLGKTIQVLAYLLSEKERGKEMRTLIVCPASLIYNWRKEIQRFTPDLTCTVIAGTQSVRQSLIENSMDSDVYVTSYDLLKRDIALYEGIHFANEIIDEAQFIKNQHTQAAQSVRVISADFRMALTGTPIENHLGELWSIMDYLMPGFLYPYSRFQQEYEVPIVNHQDEKSLERLRRMIHPFILRRLKKDVLQDLPEKLEETIVVQMEGEQKRLYEAYASRLRLSLEKKNDAEYRSSKLEILAELTRLRQLCCDPSLLVENYQGASAKLEACIELVSQAVEGGHKVLIFSQFTSMLDIICNRLSSEGYSYYRIDGSVSKEQRMDMVESFDYDEVPVFCISLKAGGTGLNLTAADIVIHFDPWWNQAAQNQATDRAHRIGQTHSVSVYELIAADTIEEQIQNIKKDKARLMEDVLSGETISASKIERAELLQLLG